MIIVVDRNNKLSDAQWARQCVCDRHRIALCVRIAILLIVVIVAILLTVVIVAILLTVIVAILLNVARFKVMRRAAIRHSAVLGGTQRSFGWHYFKLF